MSAVPGPDAETRALPRVLVQFLDRASVAIGCTRDASLAPSPAFLLVFAAIDALFVALYVESWRRTAPAPAPMTRPDRIGRETGILVLDFGRSLQRARN